MSSLPPPTTDALEHSARLVNVIRAEIESAGGWIGFDRYMALALYAPGLGYYSAGMEKFGSTGDFVTAPEISSLFGRCLARQVAQVLPMAGGEILELGAGSGRLAVDVLTELERLECLPARYRILEVSAYLRDKQKKHIEYSISPEIAQRVVWQDALPERFSGVILGNEVLDALPVHMVAAEPGGVRVRGVALEGESFTWQDKALEERALFDAVSHLDLPDGQVTEIGLASRALMASLARILEKGVILMLDYGFPQREYYHPQRMQGTLMCHYRQYAHGDPFLYPGLQDITAHVDFSAVAASCSAFGAELLGYASQAQFLINCGVTDLLAEVSPRDAAYLPRAAQAHKLLSPAEMGELFKAIALGKGIDAPLMGFARGDRRHAL